MKEGSFQSGGLFRLDGRRALVTGGTGVLGGVMADGLAEAGARVAVLGLGQAECDARAHDIHERYGVETLGYDADVLDPAALRKVRDHLLERWGPPDILVNAAGGNVARERTDTVSFFDVPEGAFEQALDLNLHGTVRPTRLFAAAMAERGRGVIVNVSSMAAMQAMSGAPGYSAAKSAIDSFTRWMAMDLARRYGDGLRVNAIAPGFFITHQNRNVLVREDGSYTERSLAVLAKTPMGRFGRPEEVKGPLVWLCSDAASFVTGIVVPIDGGFSSFSGI